MDKFLLAENPMRPSSDGLFIIHLLSPQAMIQVIEDHVQTDRPHKHYTFRNGDGVTEELTLSAYFAFSTDFIGEPEEQVMKLMDKAWRWYRAYLEWEDNNIDSDDYGKQN